MKEIHTDKRGLLIVVVTILVVVWVVQVVRMWRQKRSRLRDLASKLPGPRPLPLIGNALQFACKPEDLLDRMVEAIIPYEDVTPMRFWLGPLLYVVITDPRDIEVILHSPKSTRKGSNYEVLLPFIGDGLISGSGPTWRSHRKLVAPILNGRTLSGYVDSVQRHANIFISKLKPLANGVEFDIGPYMARCTVDAMCEIIMGYQDIKTQDRSDEEFVHSTEAMYEIIHNRMVKIWLRPEWLYRLSPGYRKQRKYQRIIQSFVEKMIAAKKEELSNTETDSSGERDSVLAQLIQLGEQTLTDEELRDEIFTIYLASQDTMAVIANFALLMLGIHKDVQENVRNEVIGAVGTENIVAESLSELIYLEMVIKETLRLFPIAPFLVRTLRNDIALGTRVIPEGCEVVVASYVTQRSSRYWKNPEMFFPERFKAEEAAKRHPHAYIPFSGGLMGCLGQKFAMMSLKTIVANVVRSYRINSTIRMEDIRIKSDISIRSINGYVLSIESL